MIKAYKLTLSLVVLTSLEITPLELAQSTPTDIKSNWSQSCIIKLSEQGIISGYPDGTFRPNALVTRAEFAMMVSKAFPKAKKMRDPVQFVDVPSNYWADNGIKQASQTGFISGYPNQIFNPNQNIPRAQILVALASGLKYSTTTPVITTLNANFIDANQIPDYAQKGIAAATEKQLVVNYPDVKLLNPNRLANRAEVSALLCQALANSKQAGSISEKYIAGGAISSSSIFVTVQQGARQKFQGLGFSSTVGGGRGYAKLTQPQKNKLQKLLCTDAKFKIVRLWFKPDKYAPQPGIEDMSVFVNPYVKSGFISDALANGCTTLLIGPDRIPDYMAASNSRYIQDSQIKNYAALLVNLIDDLKQNYKIKIHATGILNEPNDGRIRISDAQWPIMIQTLRQQLDHRGLKDVKIVTPELANGDAVAVRIIKAIKNAPKAWKDLAAISTHSYNMAATPAIAKFIEGTDKEYWITEVGTNGKEEPGNALNAASAAARFLSDMNNRVTHWIWFIGHAKADPRDNATRIIRYSLDPFQYDLFQKYYYLQQLSQTFDIGAGFRRSISSLDKSMTWTFGKKPRITVASAKNLDGSWGIAISNYTAERFADPVISKWEKTQGGYAAKSFEVTVYVEELAQAGDIKMRMYRSNSNINNKYIGARVMRKGRITIPKVESLDLITLRSR
ncbi:S-layer homology domain-containing protein [Fortiea sp. LEGE XX443]|uniref:S-layer homology domain-containing protein n=1 Tax=Fortiea sp. LEGE XX443 TaxID=1828611 RepID=UPI001880B0F1|nr:S-layer homology domain-containing protein [Fortiea sp. LEGE XX443]MBE9005294.1 S-layer homology domain-containing protein [Fortiea sp. LEGE XX443]